MSDQQQAEMPEFATQGRLDSGVFKIKAEIPGVKLKVSIDSNTDGWDHADLALQVFPSIVATLVTQLLENQKEDQDG